MNDQSSSSENGDELKFAREQGFFDKSRGIRYALFALFAFILFLFLHFKEERIEILELNSIAPGYIVSQVSFDFFDQEATSILKQEAVRDIGKIYQFSPKQVRQRRIEFENFLIYNQEWRKYVEESTFDEMYQGADVLEKLMLSIRFTDPRTLQRIKDTGLSSSNYLIYTPPELGDGVILPAQVWRHFLETGLKSPPFQSATVTFIIGFFQRMSWVIEEDIPTQRLLRKEIQATVPEKYTHMSAGSRIIDQGEKVTARHIAMLQAMKQAVREGRNLGHPLTLAGSLILALLFSGICVVYLRSNHSQVLMSNRKIGLVVTVSTLTLLFAELIEYLLITSKSNLIETVRYPIFAVFPAILLSSLMNVRIATFVSGFLTLVLMISLSFDRQGFLLVNLGAALVAILSARSLRHRKEIFIICAKSWLCCIVVIFALHFSEGQLWSIHLMSDIISTGAFLLLTAVAVIGLLPLFESLFSVMTDVTLTEYLDPNNDLLRRLTIEAPGTYQHSVVVGNIAETAALAIGANGLFCRVATLYHDIGKMVTPQYFTENQQGNMNVHQLLTPQESAEVIIDHVSEGVALARKAGLPEQFIDIIKEHHGTTLVYYFYHKQLEKMHGNKAEVNEEDFRYAGPKPRSKESAIIMIADSLEAASRSLDKITESALNELATRLVREKVEDKQFENCLLTLEELSIITQTLVKTLVAFGHSRIKYPIQDPAKADH